LYDKFISYFRKYNKNLLEKISAFGDDFNKKVLGEIRTKIKNFSEFEENTFYLYNEAKTPENELLINEKMKIKDIETVKKALNIALDILKNN
jgi:hypothetical protein